MFKSAFNELPECYNKLYDMITNSSFLPGLLIDLFIKLGSESSLIVAKSLISNNKVYISMSKQLIVHFIVHHCIFFSCVNTKSLNKIEDSKTYRRVQIVIVISSTSYNDYKKNIK